MRDVEKDGRAATVGRATTAGRATKAGRGAMAAGRAKLAIRGAAAIWKPPPPRPNAAASVETRHELPSAASAVTARTEVRVIVVVSVKVRCEDSHLPFRSPEHGHAFAFRGRVYNSFTCRLQAKPRRQCAGEAAIRRAFNGLVDTTDDEGAPPWVRPAAAGEATNNRALRAGELGGPVARLNR